MRKTRYISTTHMLARELLSKPDSFFVATDGEDNYIVTTIGVLPRDVGDEDYCIHRTLQLKKCEGNIR